LNHHPSKALVDAYAVGALPFGPALAVRTHLETCASCTEPVTTLEESEARLIENLPDAPLSPGALNAALARLNDPEEAPPATSSRFGDLPACLSETPFRARRWLTPGVWVAHVDAPRTDGWRTFLVHAAAGSAFPKHGHSGGEFVAVIRGAFDDGELYEAGDFAESHDPSEHELRITDDGPCLSLVCTQGRLVWRGMDRIIGLALDI
jgi:putative transcriptional regulator